jgi:dipeptidyl aminopeptidase/acylaminoacyl peptidase
MIEVLRQRAYPGSALILEQTLAPESSYHRYIVSYVSEGSKIYALLTVPRGEKPGSGWPVIIFNHGYIPPDQYRTTERYEAYVDAFAKSGYIVFRSDYRGHGVSEGEPEGAYGSPAYTVDVLNGLSAVKNYADADPDRIGMWGHSMGGHITLRSMVISDDIKAGVIWGGVVASYQDLFERWHRPAGSGPTPTPDPKRTRGLWRTSLEETYGSFEENPGFWDSISPNNFVSDLSGPIQLHHGTADTSVPVEFSETLFAQIQAVDQPVELYLYQGDNHNISNYFSTAIQRSIIFFDAYVKNASTGSANE